MTFSNVLGGHQQLRNCSLILRALFWLNESRFSQAIGDRPMPVQRRRFASGKKQSTGDHQAPAQTTLPAYAYGQTDCAVPSHARRLPGSKNATRPAVSLTAKCVLFSPALHSGQF